MLFYSPMSLLQAVALPFSRVASSLRAAQIVVAGQKASSGGNGLLIFAVFGVLVLAALAAGAFYLFRRRSMNTPAGGQNANAPAQQYRQMYPWNQAPLPPAPPGAQQMQLYPFTASQQAPTIVSPGAPANLYGAPPQAASPYQQAAPPGQYQAGAQPAQQWPLATPYAPATPYGPYATPGAPAQPYSLQPPIQSGQGMSPQGLQGLPQIRTAQPLVAAPAAPNTPQAYAPPAQQPSLAQQSYSPNPPYPPAAYSSQPATPVYTPQAGPGMPGAPAAGQQSPLAPRQPSNSPHGQPMPDDFVQQIPQVLSPAPAAPHAAPFQPASAQLPAAANPALIGREPAAAVAPPPLEPTVAAIPALEPTVAAALPAAKPTVAAALPAQEPTVMAAAAPVEPPQMQPPTLLVQVGQPPAGAQPNAPTGAAVSGAAPGNILPGLVEGDDATAPAGRIRFERVAPRQLDPEEELEATPTMASGGSDGTQTILRSQIRTCPHGHRVLNPRLTVCPTCGSPL